jgi:hypothetical protein
MNTKKNLIIHIILTCILLNSSIIAYGQNIGWSRMYSYDIPNLNAEFDRLSVILKNISIQSSQKEQTPLNLRAYDISTLPRFNLQSYNVQDTLYALDYQKLHRRNSPVMYRTMEQNLILGGSYATGINLSIGTDESPSYPLQIDRLAPQIVIKNSTSQYPFSISVPETTDPKAFKIGSVGVQTELEINTVDNRTYLSRPVSFNKNTGTAKYRYIADDATNYEIDVSTSLNISGNLNVSGLTTLTTATVLNRITSPIGLFDNVISATTTLRNDLTAETTARINQDILIGAATGQLRNDMIAGFNEVAISTQTLDNLKLDKSSASATYVNKAGDTMTGALVVSGIQTSSITFGDGTVMTSTSGFGGGGIGDNLGNHIATTTLDMAGNLITNVSTITAASGLSGIIITTTTFISGQLRHTYGIVSDGVGYGTSVGNSRGEGANDLQVYRAVNTHVASGDYSVISGGKSNRAPGAYSTVSGGIANAATAIGATISGGSVNTANNSYTTVSGGTENTASGWVATVSGGNRNIASGDYATVGGGRDNTAKGNYSWAAGYLSSSTAHGTFTWADSEGAPVTNDVVDQVRFKARGGFWVSTSTVYETTGLFVDSSNRVGIGTITPNSKLEVAGQIKITGSNPSDYSIITQSSITTPVLLTSTATILSTLGIGTTNPGAKLHVDTGGAGEGVRIGGSVANQSPWVQFQHSGGIGAYLGLSAPGNLFSGGENALALRTNFPIYLITDSSAGEGITIKSGNVGIGITNPQTKLAVVGLGSSASGSYLRYLTDGTGRIYYDSSSLRYKEDIQPLVDDFTKILKIEPKSFIDKATGNREIGYIAEELDTLGLKNLVGYNQDGLPDTLHYEKIVIYLLEVVKSQQEDIRILKEKLNKE